MYICKQNIFSLNNPITRKSILLVALPIVLESVAQNVLNITDTAFMGRIGEVGLGAAAIGSVFYFVFIMIAFGLGVGSQIIIARRFGEGNLKMIGRTLEQTQYLLLGFSILIFIVIRFNLNSILNIVVSSDLIRISAFDYLSIRVFGFFPAFLNASFRAFFVGIARTKVIMYTTVIMTAVNIVLNYLLIFGNFGFPEMGISGAALASVIAESSAFVFFVAYTRFKTDRKAYRVFRFQGVQFHLVKRILKIASPLMLQYFVSLSCWFTFFLLIEKMGQAELAVSNLIRSIYIFMLVPIWGFSAVTNTFVSQSIGRGNEHEVMRIIPKVLSLCIPLILFTTALIAVFPEYALKILTNDPILIAKAIPVLYVILGAAPLLTIGTIFFSALTGTGKTSVGMIIEFIVLAIYIVFTWMITTQLHWQLAAVWTVEYLYAFLLVIISFLYLKSGRWKKAIV